VAEDTPMKRWCLLLTDSEMQLFESKHLGKQDANTKKEESRTRFDICDMVKVPVDPILAKQCHR